MHKNIIFDCGNVLRTWDNQMLLDGFVERADQELFDKIVLKDEWHLLDEGMTENEYLIHLKNLLPERLLKPAENLIYGWLDYFIPIKEMTDLLIELKDKGHKLYLLSNMPHLLPDHLEYFKEYDLFDGVIFSSKVRMVKPNEDIFIYLINKYNIDVKSSLFVDDKLSNCLTAEKLGISYFEFDEHNIKNFIEFLKNDDDI